MSQRETQIAGDTQRWRGVDQRTQPTLVQNGFFTMSRGCFFGLGDNAERLPGKRLAGLAAGPVYTITQFGNIALVQSTSTLYMVPLSDLVNFTV